ncbi:SMC family ATPase [Macrococcus psychrotolerans]|uniref:Nuclease SbcCD subunit C n=1 Tax=Macrococcus psychrotolerans TaxID=3039389 RepID=A0AAU6R6G6_9STAP
MRPIKLEIQHFGPFKNETIDFKQLNNHTLFLISGKTGSGKTTIFDAMMYALYGTASTSSRNHKAMRNKHAYDEEETMIKFQFSIKDKQYLIIRNLPHIKAGNKTPITSKLEVYEIHDNEKCLISTNKKTETNQLIVDIVKLQADQFRQILILPQGEFKNFLVSDSESKNEILRTLFDTKHLELMVKRLKENVDDKIDAIRMKEKEIEFHIQQLGVGFPPYMVTYDEQIRTANLYYEALQKVFSQNISELNDKSNELKLKGDALKAAEILNNNIQSVKQHKHQLAMLYEQREEIENTQKTVQQLVQFESYLSCISQLEKLKKDDAHLSVQKKDEEQQISENKDKLQQLKSALNEVMQDDEEMKRLNHQLIEQERFVDEKYQGLEEDVNTLNELKNETTALSDKLSSTHQANETIQSSLEALIQEKTKLYEEKVKLQNHIRDNETIISLINEYDSHYKALQAIKENQDMLTEELLSCESLIERFNFGDDLLDIDAVDSIRAQLKIGQNCPVCNHIVTEKTDGVHHEYHNLVQRRMTLSREQEANATKIEWIEALMKAVTDKLLAYEQFKVTYKHEDMRNTGELLMHEQEMLTQKLETLNDHLNHINHEYEDLSNELKNNKASIISLKDVIDANEKKINERNGKKERYHTFVSFTGFKNYDDFKAQFDEKRDLYENYDKHLNHLNETIASCSELIRSKENIVDKYNTHLIYNEKLLSQLESTKNSFHISDKIVDEYMDKDIEQELETLQNTVESYYKDIHFHENTIKTLEDLIGGKKAPDIEKLSNEYAELSSKAKAFEQAINDERSQLKMLDNIIMQLEVLHETYVKQMEDIGSEIRLFEVLNGKNTLKLSIENYVLVYYLEQILLLANERLLQMTHNRYKLVRKKEVHSRKKSGLEIEVFDYHTNNVRDITTLSGGETFIASLSLALGLSDYVMQISGGINLESVFIDEGFGSLDSDTLETAIEVLIELQETGKLIGIISHVQSLQENMPAILKVRTDGFNSDTEFQLK